MGKQAFSMVVLILVGVLGAQPAFAAGPIKEPAPLEPIEFPAGLVCEFPVRIEAEANRSSVKIFPDGRVLFTGFVWTRVTNLATGESISFNNSGAATLRLNADGSLTIESRGQLLFFFFPDDLGGARLLRTTGQVRETLSPDNVVTAFSHTGGVEENLCETLE